MGLRPLVCFANPGTTQQFQYLIYAGGNQKTNGEERKNKGQRGGAKVHEGKLKLTSLRVTSLVKGLSLLSPELLYQRRASLFLKLPVVAMDRRP